MPMAAAGLTGFLDLRAFWSRTASKLLNIAVPAAGRDARDPLWKNLQSDPRLGLLIIELANRPPAAHHGDARLTSDEIILEVAQSFPNCPKYITKRAIEVEIAGVPNGGQEESEDSTLPSRIQK